MDLGKITAVDRHRKKVRVGRGSGSGLGKTSGRGSKGASSRRGFGGLLHREGGQMPLIRRIPKRGFRNTLFRVEYDVVNVGRLAAFAGSAITPEFLTERGVIANRWGRLKVLGEGDVSTALDVSAHAFSASAKKKIEDAGGKATVLAKKPGTDAGTKG